MVCSKTGVWFLVFRGKTRFWFPLGCCTSWVSPKTQDRSICRWKCLLVSLNVGSMELQFMINLVWTLPCSSVNTAVISRKGKLSLNFAGGWVVGEEVCEDGMKMRTTRSDPHNTKIRWYELSCSWRANNCADLKVIHTKVPVLSFEKRNHCRSVLDHQIEFLCNALFCGCNRHLSWVCSWLYCGLCLVCLVELVWTLSVPLRNIPRQTQAE